MNYIIWIKVFCSSKALRPIDCFIFECLSLLQLSSSYRLSSSFTLPPNFIFLLQWPPISEWHSFSWKQIKHQLMKTPKINSFWITKAIKRAKIKGVLLLKRAVLPLDIYLNIWYLNWMKEIKKQHPQAKRTHRSSKKRQRTSLNSRHFKSFTKFSKQIFKTSIRKIKMVRSCSTNIDEGSIFQKDH